MSLLPLFLLFNTQHVLLRLVHQPLFFHQVKVNKLSYYVLEKYTFADVDLYIQFRPSKAFRQNKTFILSLLVLDILMVQE